MNFQFVKKTQRLTQSRYNPEQNVINIGCCMPKIDQKWKTLTQFKQEQEQQKKPRRTFIKITQNSNKVSVQTLKTSTNGMQTKQSSSKTFSTPQKLKMTINKQQEDQQSFQKVKNDFIQQLKLWKNQSNQSNQLHQEQIKNQFIPQSIRPNLKNNIHTRINPNLISNQKVICSTARVHTNVNFVHQDGYNYRQNLLQKLSKQQKKQQNIALYHTQLKQNIKNKWKTYTLKSIEQVQKTYQATQNGFSQLNTLNDVSFTQEDVQLTIQ